MSLPDRSQSDSPPKHLIVAYLGLVNDRSILYDDTNGLKEAVTSRFGVDRICHRADRLGMTIEQYVLMIVRAIRQGRRDGPEEIILCFGHDPMEFIPALSSNGGEKTLSSCLQKARDATQEAIDIVEGPEE